MKYWAPIFYFSFFTLLAVESPEVWGFVGFSLIVYTLHLGTEKDKDFPC